MANYNWKSGVSGDWGINSDWVPGSVPNSTTADVTISSTSDIEITIGAGESFVADSVTLDSSGVTLGVAGILNLGGSKDQLIINAGTLNVASGGTIANGTINAGTGTVNLSNYATLEDITFKGNLNVTGDYSTVYSTGGLRGLSPTGSTLNLARSGDSVFIENSETWDNIGVNLGAAGQQGNDGLSVMGANSLTLGTHATINSNGTYYNFFAGNQIVNNGIINVAGGEGLVIDNYLFTNAGTINVSAGSSLVFNGATPSNLGAVHAAGTIVLATDQSLTNLVGVSLNGSGLLDIQRMASLTLEGGTLAVGGTDNIEVAGTVSNGTINSSLGTLSFGYGATLDDITYRGNLNLTAAGVDLTIVGGLSVENASGNGPGTINLTGFSDHLDGGDNETLNSLTINLGTAGQQSDDRLSSERGYGLTLGSRATVNSNGDNSNVLYGGKIVNDGIISIAGAGLIIDPTTFTNAGTVNVSSGSILQIGPMTLANSGLAEGTGVGTSRVDVDPKVDVKRGTFFGTTLNGGSFEANAGNTLALDLDGKVITTDDGKLILNGLGSEITEYQTDTSTYVSLESTLTKIGADGTLEVLGGRGYTTGNTLDIAGKLTLGGGTFTAASLNLSTSSSDIIGYGTVTDSITNAGAIFAQGGTLVIGGSLTGGGALQINATSTLELTMGTSENVTFAGVDSQLVLGAPASFTGTLGGIAAGDVVDLSGEKASSATISGTSLLVTLNNNTKLQYTLASSLPTEGVSVSSDSGTGTDLTFYQLQAAAIPKMQFIKPSASEVTNASSADHASWFALPDHRSVLADVGSHSAGLFSHTSSARPRILLASLGITPTPTSAGIVVPHAENWEAVGKIFHNLTFLPLA